MALNKYELQIGQVWYTVKGSTLGVKEGWLQWKDDDGDSGLARPGTWRVPVPSKPRPRGKQ